MTAVTGLPAHAGFLCNTAAMLTYTIKVTPLRKIIVLYQQRQGRLCIYWGVSVYPNTQLYYYYTTH